MWYTLKEHEEKKLVPKDSLNETFVSVVEIEKEKLTELKESTKDKKVKKLIVKIEAIHTGRTKNFTFYTEEGLKAGLKSWTQPYNKPVLTHHNEYNGEPIGRILNAEFTEQTLSGKPALMFTVEITDANAIEKVLDGRYQTVSIGASTDKVTCNICGTDRSEEWCNHWPGEKYEEQTCHFIVGTTYGREVSYVNTPADENAGNRSVEVVTEDDVRDTHESVHTEIYQMSEGLYQNVKNPEINLYEKMNEDVQKMFDSLLESDGKDVNEVDQEEMKESNVQSEDLEILDKKTDSKTELDESSQLKEKILKIQEAMTNLVIEKTKVENQLSELKEENKGLLEENTKLTSEVYQNLVEKVVDLKMSLRKADVIGVKREEAIEAHSTRTKESLTDTLNDLLSEQKTAFRPEPGSVKNPGLSESDEDNVKKINISEAENILASMFGRKKKK